MATQFHRTACTGTEVMAQATLLALMAESGPAVSILESLEPSEWSVTSFDPSEREVCVTIQNNTGLRYLVFTLPFYIR